MAWGALAFALVVSALPSRALAASEFDLAMLRFKAGKYLEAAAAFQSFVDETPGYDYGHFMLGHCLLKMNRFDEAEKSFRKAVELRGGKPQYLHGLALALRKEGKYALALETLAMADPGAADPHTAFALLTLRGFVLASVQRWTEATVALEKALAYKRDKAVLDQLGKANFARGFHDRAAAAFRESIAIDPYDEGIHVLLADSLIQLAADQSAPARKRAAYEQALGAAQRLRAMWPADPEADSLVGRAALGAGRLDIAGKALRAYLRSVPGSCAALVDLARAQMAEREWGEAESGLLKAEGCVPGMPVVDEALGYVYFMQGRYGDAAGAYRRAHALQPSPATQQGMAAAEARLRSKPSGPRVSPAGE